MKILLVLQHNRFTGVNTWAYTLAKHFIDDGHFVSFKIIPEKFRPYYDVSKPKFFDYCKSANISIILPDESANYNKFDVIFLNYLFHLEEFNTVTAKKIFVAHGKAMCEGLYDYNFNGKVIAVSQYLYDLINANYSIPNGIDLDLFDYMGCSAVKLKRGLVLSRYSTHFTEQLINSFKQNDIELQFVGNDFGQREIRDMIHLSDFVIGIGRSAYEGMACGKAVFVSDGRTLSTWVTERNFNELFYYNMNMAYLVDGAWDDDVVSNEIKNYSIFMGDINRKLAEMYLSSDTMYCKYLSII